ncbi:gluconate 2-dehydrogenase subunit 3 family protein [Virgibacillus siamensis]|uniref:gluconate 2-dehydrogenase subunit 3 family protein n=1 Tax=Virgibacillus siamensis TaxID=480071 RepID=UPI0009876258|nr:gluconate 2-dehydrogenase subunit 3 family protein [Virgibacillus siamensis]
MADEEKSDDKISRRKFIRNSSYLAGGAIGGTVLGTFIGTNFLDEETANKSQNNNQPTNFNRALKFFTRQADFQILSAACERIYPKDDLGPGAIELGAPFFIDHELAGAYGNNEREYMKGPFSEGTDYQGYQTPLKRNAVFMAGIRALEKESQSAHNKGFVELDGEQQDKILTKFEDDKIKLKHVSSAYFFELLRSATISGTYADPLYGGNADMEGWKMKDFPGSQMSYLNRIGSKKFIKIKPKSLGDHYS